jgi:hypothetical protein
MPSHSAKSLFEKNIRSAKDCATLYHKVKTLDPEDVNIKWILRAAIVFTVSALDAYFHDKVKYRIGRIPLSELPDALMKFEIPVSALLAWDKAKRKRNVLRNLVVANLSTKPLQSQNAIAETLKLVNIKSFWNKVEPDKTKRMDLLHHMDEIVHRRNKISHEGDRLTSRRSGKKLRPIIPIYVLRTITFALDLVDKVEKVFPD